MLLFALLLVIILSTTIFLCAMELLCTKQISLQQSLNLNSFLISYVITEEILEKAYQEAVNDGRKVKMLVFTNPNNPTGNIFSKDEMMLVLRFCRKYNIHLVYCFFDYLYSFLMRFTLCLLSLFLREYDS